MTEIRSNHPYGYRSGQWAVLIAKGTFNQAPVYVVQFPDGAVDMWNVNDAAGQYELREKS